MDAIALLIADHNRVRGLFTRFKQAKEDDSQELMAALGGELSDELTIHTSLEEELFYPWAAALSDDIKETIDEGIEEHHVVKVLMEEISDLTPEQPEWKAKLTVLIENVEHHAEEEETELFPSIRKASGADERTAVGASMEERKRQLGAPVLADKVDLTTSELRDLASAQEIPGRSTMDHDELAATVAPPR